MYLLKDSKVLKHRIKAGKYLLDGTQIVDEGLEDGMQVITNGGVRVENGQQVTLETLTRDGDLMKDVVPQTGEEPTSTLRDSDS